MSGYNPLCGLAGGLLDALRTTVLQHNDITPISPLGNETHFVGKRLHTIDPMPPPWGKTDRGVCIYGTLLPQKIHRYGHPKQTGLIA